MSTLRKILGATRAVARRLSKTGYFWEGWSNGVLIGSAIWWLFTLSSGGDDLRRLLAILVTIVVATVPYAIWLNRWIARTDEETRIRRQRFDADLARRLEEDHD